MASINKRGNKWQVRICRKNSLTICKTFTLFKDAQTWARNIELKIERGEALGKDTVQLNTLIERYQVSVSPSKKGYKQEIPRLRAWLKHPLSKRDASSIKPVDIATYRDQRIKAGKSSSTVRIELSLLSSVFKHAKHEWGYTNLSNPVADIKRPAPSKGRDRRLEGQELEALLNETNGTYMVTSQSVRGTKKRSVYPEYEGYDSTNVSLGQDSLSSIATALASFNKLKRILGNDYKGGLLIIDEVDAGFHPHAQIELLNELKSKARALQIQVVATTHSLTMLENAHAGIYDKRIKGKPLDQIIYLKGGRPVSVLDSSEFQAIYDDMHLRLRKSNAAPLVKVYVEDDEAALFLNAILTTARKRTLLENTGYSLKVIAAKVGCSNLVGLLKADEYFESVVIVLDGDTTTVNAGGRQRCWCPNISGPIGSGHSLSQTLQSITVILFKR